MASQYSWLNKGKLQLTKSTLAGVQLYRGVVKKSTLKIKNCTELIIINTLVFFMRFFF